MLLIESPYIIGIFIAWLGSHVVKNCVRFLRDGDTNFLKGFFESGGMPSSHTATVSCLATIIGLKDGFGSALFGIASLLAVIVAYDALKVRRSSGEQGLAVRDLIKEQNSNVKVPYISRGHTPLEVAFGAIFGAVIGVVVFLSTK